MTFGIQINDSAGTALLDPTQRVTRVLGSVTTGTTAGSATFSYTAAGGTPWYSLICTSYANSITRPNVTISSDTLSWTFGSTGTPAACTIITGVY